jgi:hypothetical protein
MPFLKLFLDDFRFTIHLIFYFIRFASAAGGLRNCNAAAFASLKKFAAPFF